MQKHLLRSFGRTKGRALSLEQAGAISDQLGPLRISAEIATDTNPSGLLPNCKEVWLEVGFGSAEHLIKQAINNPDVLFIGAEPFMDGVAKALRQITDFGLKNIRLIDDDVRPVIEKFAPNSIDRVFVLFPDPWQKAKHNKRRILNADFIAQLSRLLKANGRLRIASDWADYVEQIKEIMATSADFTLIDNNAIESADGTYKVPVDHFTTRYEEKRLGDCLPVFLDYVRK